MRRISSLIALTLFFSQMIPADAAVKSGASCKKPGAVSIVKAVEYTCKKKGKKLVWSKGNTVKGLEKKEENSATKPVSVTYPTSPEVEKVEALVTELVARSKPSKSVVELIVGPGEVNQSLAGIVQGNIDVSLKIAEALGFEFTRGYKVYVGDKDWLIPLMPEGTWCASRDGGVPAGSSAGFCGYDSGVIFVNQTGFLNSDGRSLLRDFKSADARRLVSISFSHEIFHAMQAEFARKYAGTRGFFNQFWLNEGGASLVGAIAFSVIENIPYRQARTWIATYQSCLDQPEVIKLMDFNANTGAEGVCGPYVGGFFWSEYLVSQTGEIGALLNLAKTNRSALDQLIYDPNNVKKFEGEKLRVALQDIYQIELDKFTLDANDYFAKSSRAVKSWAMATGNYRR